MGDPLANAIAEQDSTDITGAWQRHLPARFLARAMDGRTGYSRWGRDPGFPLLYLGRPPDSVVVEAYRHLVDPVEDPTIRDNLAPRALVTADVAVTEILDLRGSSARRELDLTLQQVQSPTNDRAAYGACQEVAAAARRHGFHGIVAPAATHLGDTLALFSDRIPTHEVPIVREWVLWDRLPDDPRSGGAPHLQIVRP